MEINYARRVDSQNVHIVIYESGKTKILCGKKWKYNDKVYHYPYDPFTEERNNLKRCSKCEKELNRGYCNEGDVFVRLGIT